MKLREGVMVVSIILIAISCEKKTKSRIKQEKIDHVITVIDTVYMHGNETMQYGFGLPDTLYQNTVYNGVIIYKGVLDSVNTKLLTKDGKARYILYYMTKTDSINYDFNYLKNHVKLDTLGAAYNDSIYLFNLQFKKPGIHYIDGIIEDEVYIDDYNGKGKTRIITNQIRATHKVYVKPNNTEQPIPVIFKI